MKKPLSIIIFSLGKRFLINKHYFLFEVLELLFVFGDFLKKFFISVFGFFKATIHTWFSEELELLNFNGMYIFVVYLELH